MSDEFRIAAVSYRALHLKFLALENELAAAQKDAERYRWLRRFDHFSQVDSMLDTTEYNTLDAAVDAAIGKVKP